MNSRTIIYTVEVRSGEPLATLTPAIRNVVSDAVDCVLQVQANVIRPTKKRKSVDAGPFWTTFDWKKPTKKRAAKRGKKR